MVHVIENASIIYTSGLDILDTHLANLWLVCDANKSTDISGRTFLIAPKTLNVKDHSVSSLTFLIPHQPHNYLQPRHVPHSIEFFVLSTTTKVPGYHV